MSDKENGMNVYIRHFDEVQGRLLARVATAKEAEDIAASVESNGWYVDESTHADQPGVSTQYISERRNGIEFVGFEIIVGVGQELS